MSDDSENTSAFSFLGSPSTEVIENDSGNIIF